MLQKQRMKSFLAASHPSIENQHPAIDSKDCKGGDRDSHRKRKRSWPVSESDSDQDLRTLILSLSEQHSRELKKLRSFMRVTFQELSRQIQELRSQVQELRRQVKGEGLLIIISVQPCRKINFKDTGIYAATESVIKFWNSCCVNDDEKVFTLADGVHFLGDPSFGNKIFVRGSYNALIDIAFKEFGSGLHGVVVSGNPG